MSVKNSNFKLINEGLISGKSCFFIFDNYYKFNKDEDGDENEFFEIYKYKPISKKLINFIKKEDIRGYESYIFFSINPIEWNEEDDINQYKKIHYIKFNTSSAVALSLCGIDWYDEDEDEDEENQHLI